MAGQRPPGWYVSPGDPALLRWFDGHVWTQHTVIASQRNAPLPPADPAAAARSRSEFRAAVAHQTQAAQRNRAEHIAGAQRGTRRILWALAAAFVLLAGGCGVMLGITSEHAAETPAGSTGAYLACQNDVRARLKAPDTATFPLDLDTAVTKVGSVYVVSSYVDASNSFGAKFRRHFVCHAQLVDHAWQISLSGLQ